jgi:general secretion pathway protein D
MNGFALGGAGLTSGGTLFGVILNALDQDVESNILSTPSLMTLDNETASIIVGSEIPITTGEALGDNNANPFRTIERMDVGVQLNIQPQISEGDTIKLFITQEVSSVEGVVSPNVPELITNKRRIETTVTVDDGEILVLGGLIENNEQVTVNKVPFLGDLPLLGAAFRSQARSNRRTNLMVFIRTTIVRDRAGAEAVTNRKYDYMRNEQFLRSGDVPALDLFNRDVIGPAPAPAGEAETAAP